MLSKSVPSIDRYGEIALVAIAIHYSVYSLVILVLWQINLCDAAVMQCKYKVERKGRVRDGYNRNIDFYVA